MNRTAMRTLEILEYIASSKTALGTSEISRQLDYPKSSVYDILNALLSFGYIEYDNNDMKTFRVGLKTFQVGMKYLDDNDLQKISYPILEYIGKKTGETVYLAIEDKGEIVYLNKVESESPIRSTCSIGSRNNMTVTGLGKAILAGYPREKVKMLTEGKFVKRTENTIMTYERLAAELDEIAESGYSVDNGEDNIFVRCIAAPLRNHTNDVVGAISVSMLDVKFTEEKKQEVIKIVTEKALEISHKLGYLKNELYPKN